MILLQLTDKDVELPGQTRIATEPNQENPHSIKIPHLLTTPSRFSPPSIYLINNV